ncbi:hypothetical protein, partial [Sphaerisporangium sp. TRM90804]|uniref:hypothetical protein n=1 Tax=Sphaerisporangium sp. TRM90804 TaxID=3031113 RepID=UPI0024474918
AVAAHEADTTAVHGIADTSALETTSGATAKVSAHAGASDPHGDRAHADAGLAGKASTGHTHAGVYDPAGTAAAAVAAADPCEIRPADHGLAAWTLDPVTLSTSGFTPTAGVLFLARVRLGRQLTLSGAHLYITASGTAPTNCYVGVYDSSGALQAATADQAGAWTGTGLRSPAFAAPYSAPAGLYWVAVLIGGGTPPALARGAMGGGFSGMANVGATVASSRFATIGSGLTALPASITPGSLTPANQALWAALA